VTAHFESFFSNDGLAPALIVWASIVNVPPEASSSRRLTFFVVTV
jgi:hypothetical protein